MPLCNLYMILGLQSPNPKALQKKDNQHKSSQAHIPTCLESTVAICGIWDHGTEVDFLVYSDLGFRVCGFWIVYLDCLKLHNFGASKR